jgi:hypothetical protein
LISLLGSEIGRGHAFYLDGVATALRAAGRPDLAARRADVFGVSRGLARGAWLGVRAAWTIAGRGGLAEALTRRARSRVDHDRDSRLLRLLGRDLRRWAGDAGLVVVDHPALVGALGERPGIWYVHGEHAAPREAIVRRAARIFVPSRETAAAFERGGVARERLIVTGLCVDPALVPQAAGAALARQTRIASREPLGVAFLSSGAEPVAHVAALAAGAAALAGSHRALVFARRGGRLERAVRRLGVERIGFSGRDELDRETARCFPAIDVVVSPPHERSHWALGLGVPFLLVGPDLGPFAPLNRALLLREGVAVEIRDRLAAARLPRTLAALRGDGRLLAMSRRGCGRPIDGFSVAARALVAAAG